MTKFFTSDSHFTHTNIIKHCNRPFDNIYEHDEALISNWNSVVKPKDTVYHLGDVGFNYRNVEDSLRLKKILMRLHGQIILIRGNHDGQFTQCLSRFQTVKDTHLIKESDIRIFMSHYAHRTWQFSFRGAIHLYGHSHGNLPSYGKSFDVGVDCWNYTPISFDQVVEHARTLSMENYILD